MRRCSIIIPLAIFAASCSSAAKPPAAASTSGSPAARSSAPAIACVGGLTGKVTDHGTATFAGSTATLEAENDVASGYSAAEYYFKPTCAYVHGTVKMTVKNEGSVPHNFSIASLKVNSDLAPGKSVTVALKFPPNGIVPFFCAYHRELGMQGAFIAG